jgi:hypothetical protein
MRDLGQVAEHVHDAEIEIGEGPEPPGLRRVSLELKAKNPPANKPSRNPIGATSR